MRISNSVNEKILTMRDQELLKELFFELTKVFNKKNNLEALAIEALNPKNVINYRPKKVCGLSKPFIEVMKKKDAHRVCKNILKVGLEWSPPTTSMDKLYIEDSLSKAHVELVGPEGIVKSETLRIGLYGMLPNSEYGIRTHPAEEVYIMLAGTVFWKVYPRPYLLKKPNDRSNHPSMIGHANKTTTDAFMSIYVWHGDVSTSNYQYKGIN